MTYTLTRLAELACALPIEQASDSAARGALLDLVTAAAAAPRRPVAAALASSCGAGSSAVWFTGQSAALASAAFANSFAACALDLDDGHRRSRGHPGAAVIPAVLAEADRLDAAQNAEMRAPTDRAILHAITVGYEVGIRIASARGFYARTGYWGGYGAAAGVATLRGLGPMEFARALAITGETSPQMLTTTGGPAWPQPIGSDVKEGVPWSVANGIVAVGLAQAGFDGPLDMLDHKPFFDGDAILAPRPTRAIDEVYTKFYCCCRHLHAPIDALLSVMRLHELAAADIEAIEVGAYSGALRVSNRVEPANLVDVQYSIPYGLGLVALHGTEVFLPLGANCLGDAAATAIARRVRLFIDPECEARFPAQTPVRVTVLARGQRFVSAITTPRGEADTPVSWSERIAKFEQVTRFALTLEERRGFVSDFSALAEGQLGPLRQRLRQATRAAPTRQ